MLSGHQLWRPRPSFLQVCARLCWLGAPPAPGGPATGQRRQASCVLSSVSQAAPLLAHVGDFYCCCYCAIPVSTYCSTEPLRISVRLLPPPAEAPERVAAQNHLGLRGVGTQTGHSGMALLCSALSETVPGDARPLEMTSAEGRSHPEASSPLGWGDSKGRSVNSSTRAGPPRVTWAPSQRAGLRVVGLPMRWPAAQPFTAQAGKSHKAASAILAWLEQSQAHPG